MKSPIRLSAIHSCYPQLPETANPRSMKFDPLAPKKFVESNLEKTLGFIHDAGKKKVDLVCTHEDFKGQAHYGSYLENPQLFVSLAEEIPGPTSRTIGELAKKYSMHVAVNYYEKDGGHVYNTSVLIGRNGEIAGKYRKIHLPSVEKWMVTAGTEFSVFDTDIGKIGFATCYDIIFTEHCRALAQNGADIIIHQTAGWGIVNYKIGEALVRVRAAENFVYLVVAKDIRRIEGPKSCIIDNYGEILAEEQWKEEKVVIAEFAPDFELISDHFESLFSGVSSIRARMALEREPSLYSTISNEHPPLIERLDGVELTDSPDKVTEMYKQWKQYEEDIKNNRPVKVKYHWNR